MKERPLDVMNLKIFLSEVNIVLKGNYIDMKLEKWDGRGKEELIQLSSVGNLRYDRFI